MKKRAVSIAIPGAGLKVNYLHVNYMDWSGDIAQLFFFSVLPQSVAQLGTVKFTHIQ